MKKNQTKKEPSISVKKIYDFVLKLFVAIVLSFILCLFISFIVIVAPNDHIKYKEDKPIVEHFETSAKRSESINQLSPRDGNLSSSQEQISGDETKVKYVDSRFKNFVKYLKREFSTLLFLCFTVIFLMLQFSGVWKDYFPTSPEAKESGIHAKLNYQVIADRLSRKLSILILFILVLSISFIFCIFRFATDLDSIIHREDIASYNLWIESIEDHLGKNDPEISEDQKNAINQFIEENTKMYWLVYFIRFIVVRSIIAITVGIIISFLIRLYNRTRRDKEAIIAKEEALSAIHYLARGEWRFKYDLNGNLLYEGVEEVIDEKTYHTLSAGEKKNFKPQLLEHLTNDDYPDAKLKTRDLLNIIPVHELFKLTSENSSKSKQKEIEQMEMIHDSHNLSTGELSDVTDKLESLTKLFENALTTLKENAQ